MKIFKILNGISLLLLVFLSVFFGSAVLIPEVAALPGVPFVVEYQNEIISVIIIFAVVNLFLASLVSQGKVSFGTITTALKDIATGQAFTEAEKRWEGEQKLSDLAGTIASFKLLIPKDSELYTLLEQIEKTLIDLFDGPEEGDPL